MSWKMLNRLACGTRRRCIGGLVVRVKVFLLVIASLLVALAVAAGGVIGFVGLMVPHAMRRVVGRPLCRLASFLLTLRRDFTTLGRFPGPYAAFWKRNPHRIGHCSARLSVLSISAK